MSLEIVVNRHLINVLYDVIECRYAECRGTAANDPYIYGGCFFLEDVISQLMDQPYTNCDSQPGV